MEQYLFFDPQSVNPYPVFKGKSGREYSAMILGAHEFWARYWEDTPKLKYLSKQGTNDDIWFMYRKDFGPVCQLSYDLELDCIMGISTAPGYDREGLASFLLGLFIKELNKDSIFISSFTAMGAKYLQNVVIKAAKINKIDIYQHSNEKGLLNLRVNRAE